MQIRELSEEDVSGFYRAAAVGLNALATVDGRKRLDANADAAWRAFRGELREDDRLDLLIRDAAVLHAAAFAPRVVFSLEGLAGDEPFGPDWPGVLPSVAKKLMQESEARLEEAARAWGLHAGKVEERALAKLLPATKIVAAGAGAVMALFARFAGNRELDLADQVVFIADRPGERQLFGLAVALAGGTTRQARLLRTDETEKLRRVDLVVVSNDAESAASDGARALAG